jgi:hypothetical protein
MDWYYATQRSVITLPKLNQLMNSMLYLRCSCLLKLPLSDLECQKLGRNRFLPQMTMVALESWLLHNTTVFFALLRMILYAIHIQGSALMGINNLITFNMHTSSQLHPHFSKTFDCMIPPHYIITLYFHTMMLWIFTYISNFMKYSIIS